MRRTVIRKSASRKGMGLGVRLSWEGRAPPSPVPAVSISDLEVGGAVARPRRGRTWTNLLALGDNRLLIAALGHGELGESLAKGGGLALIYIDPPYAMETDFHVPHNGDGSASDNGLAFRDSWGSGAAYLQFMYERLVPMRGLLREDGVLCLHCDWRANAWLRVLLDEIFGRDCFRNEIIWRRAPNLGNQAAARQLGRVADSILVYSKVAGSTMRGKMPVRSDPVALTGAGRPRGAKWDEAKGEWFTCAPRGDYTDASVEQLRRAGRVFDSPSGKVYIKYALRRGEDGRWYKDQPVDTIWADAGVKPLRHCSREELDVGYPTQKPLGLLRRLIEWTTREGDLVADFFCGSGTALVAAEQLRRGWVGCDVGARAFDAAAGRLAKQRATFRAVAVEAE